jgi:putative spermidine/putrescine transport system substrate-binding protein
MGSQDHHAGHRHRLQSEKDRDAAEELGRIVGAEIQGPRRPHRAQQPTGLAFLAELNRIKGGDEGNFEPAFKALRELLPNVGAIAANLGAYATLWQQEQIDIAPYNFNFVQTLKGKDVPVELAIPPSGPVGWATSLHLVANAAEPELAVKYIDEHLDADIQAQMLKPPYDVIPTNSKVKLEGAITQAIAKNQDDLAKIRTIDWDKLNPQRGALIDRFNREIKL